MLRKRSNSKTNITEIAINKSASSEIKHKKCHSPYEDPMGLLLHARTLRIYPLTDAQRLANADATTCALSEASAAHLLFAIPILPPSPKVINDTVEIETKQEDGFATSNVLTLRNSTALFDPDNASPASDFIQLLKLRMSIYYEPEMDILA